MHRAITPRSPSESSPDQRLAERVRQALSESGYSMLEAVVVTVHEGAIVLRGTVPSYFMKQIAQEVAKATVRVNVLSNRLTVKSVAMNVE